MSPAAPGKLEPGTLFLREIHEQPDVLDRLAGNTEAFSAVAAEIRRRGCHLIRMVGHGSSDNAATYGIYAFGLIANLTALRDSISLSVYYGATVDTAGSCVLALSQSGRTPDVVDYVERAARSGALTIAATNDPASPLSRAADLTLPLLAAEERAVAATKTYSAQLATLALLAAHVAGEGERYAEGMHATAALLRDWLPGREQTMTAHATQLAYVGRMLVLGRGPEFATARETALKLLETCRIGATPLTSTDLSHGPVAALDGLFPVWAIVGDDAGLPFLQEAIARAHGTGATVIASGAAAGDVREAGIRLPVPAAPLPLLAPLLSVVPGQLLAWALALTKRLDPDAPSGLAKVTMAH